MSLCLGFDAATQYWLTKAADETLPEPASGSALARAEASARSVARETLPVDPSPSHPVHLVVANRSRGHAMAEAVAHVWAADLPDGALCHLSGDNTIGPPELTFVQMASKRSLLATIELGCYLCSGFPVDEGGHFAGTRNPITSVETLTRFVKRIPTRVRGARCTRAALAYISDGTASPMEIFLMMAYGLPLALGGRDPFVLQANQVILITGAYRSRSERVVSRETSIFTTSMPISNMRATSFTRGDTASITPRLAATPWKPWAPEPYPQPMARWDSSLSLRTLTGCSANA